MVNFLFPSIDITRVTDVNNKQNQHRHTELDKSFRMMYNITINRKSGQLPHPPHPNSETGWIGGMKRSPLDSPWSKTLRGFRRASIFRGDSKYIFS